MLYRLMRRAGRRRKRGFTLVEAAVAIAVFAVSAAMLAMILFTATQMVQYSLAYDSDREALMEFIASGSETGSDRITVEVIKEGEPGTEQFTLDLSKGKVKVDGEYIIYTLNDTGRRYSIFVAGGA